MNLLFTNQRNSYIAICVQKVFLNGLTIFINPYTKKYVGKINLFGDFKYA